MHRLTICTCGIDIATQHPIPASPSISISVRGENPAAFARRLEIASDRAVASSGTRRRNRNDSGTIVTSVITASHT